MKHIDERFNDARMLIGDAIEKLTLSTATETELGVDIILSLIKSITQEYGAFLVACDREDICPGCGESNDVCDGDDDIQEVESN